MAGGPGSVPHDGLHHSCRLGQPGQLAALLDAHPQVAAVLTGHALHLLDEDRRLTTHYRVVL